MRMFLVFTSLFILFIKRQMVLQNSILFITFYYYEYFISIHLYMLNLSFFLVFLFPYIRAAPLLPSYIGFASPGCAYHRSCGMLVVLYPYTGYLLQPNLKWMLFSVIQVNSTFTN